MVQSEKKYYHYTIVQAPIGIEPIMVNTHVSITLACFTPLRFDPQIQSRACKCLRGVYKAIPIHLLKSEIQFAYWTRTSTIALAAFKRPENN